MGMMPFQTLARSSLKRESASTKDELRPKTISRRLRFRPESGVQRRERSVWYLVEKERVLTSVLNFSLRAKASAVSQTIFQTLWYGMLEGILARALSWNGVVPEMKMTLVP